MPFDIPDNWTWVRHNSIFEIFGGSQPPKDKFIGYPKEGYIRLYQIRDYGPKPEPVYIPIKDAHKVTVKGDILLARYGASVGKVFFAEDGAYNVAMAKVEKLYVNDYIDKMFLYTFYKSSLYQSLVLNNSRSAQAGFNKEDLNSLLIPLPPLEEQIRIVEKINSFEPLIAQYSIAEERLSILEEEFPEKLKKSILQYAIEGKLVKQDPNDEPASVLLERIKAEKEGLIKEGKIKRDKNESYIYQGDDKNYYENIPVGWAICSLNDLAIYKKGPFGSSLTKGMFVSEPTPNRIKVYEQKNAIQHDESLGNYYITRQKYLDMIGFTVGPLDFIVSCAGTIGEIYKLPQAAPIGIINQALMKVTLISEEISDYFEIIFYDALHKLSEKSKGTAIKNIAPFEILKPAIVFIPPLEEQQRIINKLSTINLIIES